MLQGPTRAHLGTLELVAVSGLTRRYPLSIGEAQSPPTRKQPSRVSDLQKPELGGRALVTELTLKQHNWWEEPRMGSQGVSASSPCMTLWETFPLSGLGFTIDTERDWTHSAIV